MTVRHEPRLRLGLAVAASVGASGAAVALMASSAWLLSRAAEHPPVLYLLVAIVGVRAFGLSRGVFRYLERLAGHDVALRRQADLRVRAYAALADRTWIGRRRGDLLSRMINDVGAITDHVVRVSIPIIAGAVVLAGGAIALTVISPTAGAAIAATLLLGGGLLPWWTARLAASGNRALGPLRGRLADTVAEAAGAAPDVIAYGAADLLLDRVDRADRELRDAERRIAWTTGLAGGAQLVTTGLAVLAGLLLGAYAVQAGDLAPVNLAVLTLTPLALHEVLTGLPLAGQLAIRSRAALTRVDELLTTPAPTPAPAPSPFTNWGQIAPPTAVSTSSAPSWSVTAEAGPSWSVTAEAAGVAEAAEAEAAKVELAAAELAVGWPESAPVLTGLSFTVGPGERVALVGPSGVGKTTVAATLLGLIPPIGGQFAVSGSIGYLAQDAHLFDTSVRENLKLGDANADDDRLREVLTRVRLDLDLDRLVGEHGSQVSGGEARRIALARLLLAERAVWIVDEPTEHLDRPTADAVVDDLFAAAGDGPLLVITHDPLLIARCDRIIECTQFESLPSPRSEPSLSG